VSLSDDLSANVSQTVGLIPYFPQPARIGLSALARENAQGSALGLTSFGVRFDLSSNQVDLLRDALLHLPLECKRSFSASISPQYSLIHRDESSAKRSYRLYRSGRLLFACADRAEFLHRFASVLSLYVAEASRKRTFVHAGVVGWGDRAVLIPGRSFSGKTTLVAELVRAGAIYYSDEFAVIDKQGMVYPYARPLQVRENGSRDQTERPVEHFGGVAGQEPLPVGLVIVSRYKPEAHWRPRQISPGVGLLKILDNTVSARRAPAVAMSTLKQVVSDALIVRGVRGEASQVVDWITAHFGPPSFPFLTQ
jgi:hypothetical protein